MDNNIIFSCIFATLALCFVAMYCVCAISQKYTKAQIIFKAIGSNLVAIGAIIASYINTPNVYTALMIIALIFMADHDMLTEAKPLSKKIVQNSYIVCECLVSILYLTSVILLWKDLKWFWVFFAGALVIAILLPLILEFLAEQLKFDFTGYKVQVFLNTFLLSFVTVMSLGIGIYVPGFLTFAIGMVLYLAGQIVGYCVDYRQQSNTNLLRAIHYGLTAAGSLLVMFFMFFMTAI